MPDQIGEYAETPMSRGLLMRFERVHRYRSIGVLSGPPGVGKTTAARRFVDGRLHESLHITMPSAGRKGLIPLAASDIILDTIWNIASPRWGRPDEPGGRYARLAGSFNQAIRSYFGIGRDDGPDPSKCRLTIIVDEAQNLSREAIELLRYLNDEAAGYSPFAVGLIFLGNNEFALKSGANGQSVITDAVADRALFAEALSYQDLTEEDLRLVLEPQLEIEDAALDLAIRCLMARPNRSFRTAKRFCIEASEEAELSGAPIITTTHVAAVLGLA